MFRAKRLLRLRGRNSILITNISVYIIHLVVIVFQNINLSNFACLLVDFGKVLCSSANELQQNSNASFREDYISQILTALNLETFALTFDLCGLLSFVCHLYTIAKTMQLLLRTISPSDRILDRFTSLVWNFSRCVADVPLQETIANGKERREMDVFAG